MIAGITDKEQKIITGILQKYYNKYSFYYFGSRVKGTYSRVSDLDILIKGTIPISYEDMDNIKEEFDKSSIPYIVNFVDYHNINKDFYECIKDELCIVE